MDVQTVVAICYSKNFASACIRRDNKFTLIKPFTDVPECDVMKSVFYKFSVDLCILTTSLATFRFKFLKETGVKFKLVEGSWFTSSIKTYEGLPGKCLNAMCKLYRKDFVKLDSNGRIGFIGDVPVELFDVANHSYLDNDAVAAFKLVNQITHPSVLAGAAVEKDSLFELINFTVTSSGKELLKQWMLWPLNACRPILNRLSHIEECRSIYKLLLPQLKKCRMYKNDSYDFTRIQNFLEGIVGINNLLLNTDLQFRGDVRGLKNLVKRLSVYENFRIKKGAFKELDDLREAFEELPEYLNNIAEIVAKEEKKVLSIVYFPQVGYLLEVDTSEKFQETGRPYAKPRLDTSGSSSNNITENRLYTDVYNTGNKNTPVKLSKYSYLDTATKKNTFDNDTSIFTESLDSKKSPSNDGTPGSTKLPDINLHNNKLLLKVDGFKFKLGTKEYYKNEIMKIMDKDLGDLHSKIKDFEIDVQMNILKSIESLDLLYLLDYMAYIDAIYALAVFSVKYTCIRPKFSEVKLLKMEKFMHQEVSINLTKSSIIKGQPSFIVPLGQAVVLAHMGSYVPCRTFELKIFDKIFTKVLQNESLTHKKSAFLSDLLKIKQVINESTIDSLCLIKDLGVGTNYSEGLGLFYAIHRHLDHLFVISITNLDLELAHVGDECGDSKKPTLKYSSNSQKCIDGCINKISRNSINLDTHKSDANSDKNQSVDLGNKTITEDDHECYNTLTDGKIQSPYYKALGRAFTDKSAKTHRASLPLNQSDASFVGMFHEKQKQQAGDNVASSFKDAPENECAFSLKLLPNYDLLHAEDFGDKMVVHKSNPCGNNILEALRHLKYDESFINLVKDIQTSQYPLEPRNDTWAVETVNKLIHNKKQ